MEPQHSTGFAPILGKRPRVLILGTLPSRKSLEKQEYYGHAQNAFWKIMAVLFDVSGDYLQRCEGLTRHGIAVWDVLARSVRPGSMDSAIDIQSAEPNALVDLLNANDSIELVCFNGQKAGQLFDRLVGRDTLERDLMFVVLPSTSPAYAAMSVADKTRIWRSWLARATDCRK